MTIHYPVKRPIQTPIQFNSIKSGWGIPWLGCVSASIHPSTAWPMFFSASQVGYMIMYAIAFYCMCICFFECSISRFTLSLVLVAVGLLVGYITWLVDKYRQNAADVHIINTLVLILAFLFNTHNCHFSRMSFLTDN